jgi:uncharacterized protein (TIGR02466 family)|tara:strand:+ start:120 stop:740 length:621 start_codon:yes stop_codon:yes gene_type:complete
MKDKITEAQVLELFPQIVSMYKVETNFNSKQLNIFKKGSEDCYQNEGNTTSTNNFILNLSAFKNLKKELLKRVEFHCYEILKIDKKIKPYITQSWLNYTQQNQYHHIHSHPNSFLSAVYYISCDDDTISFQDFTYKQIDPIVEKHTRYNSARWDQPTKTYDLFLFSSALKHSVKIKKTDTTRISLAFNVFLKGEVGKARNLTYLKI